MSDARIFYLKQRYGSPATIYSRLEQMVRVSHREMTRGFATANSSCPLCQAKEGEACLDHAGAPRQAHAVRMTRWVDFLQQEHDPYPGPADDCCASEGEHDPCAGQPVTRFCAFSDGSPGMCGTCCAAHCCVGSHAV